MVSNDKWMSIEQLSHYLGIKVQSIYSLTHRRKIPFTKIGRRLRFNREEIDDWLKHNSFGIDKKEKEETIQNDPRKDGKPQSSLS